MISDRKVLLYGDYIETVSVNKLLLTSYFYYVIPFCMTLGFNKTDFEISYT